jgi:hypothetical protein
LERSAFSLAPDSKEGQPLVGHLLGDGYMIRYKAKTSRGSQARFCFAQGLIHKDYFYFVYDIFKQYCNGPAYEHKVVSKLGGPSEAIQFNTLTLPCFNYYYELFYPNGLKIVPRLRLASPTKYL